MAVKDIGYSSLEALVNYSGTNYSPNNIRRIIISPEGVGVFYFVGKKAELKEFPLLTYMQYLKGTNPKDFKPMLSVLYSGKQLTSVEEIIILPMGSNGASVLHPDEYSIRTIVGNRGASSYEGCKNSYKRLRYISIIQNVTFKQFLGAIRGNKEDFISDMSIFSNVIQRNEVWGTDYYKQNGISIKSREMYPKMDGAGGSLAKYFEDFRLKKEQEIKSSAIASQKAEATKGLRSDFDKVYEDYTYAVTCLGKLLKVVSKYGFNGLSDYKSDYRPLKADIKKFSGMRVNEKYVNLIECNNDKEALEFNIKSLRESVQRIYLLVATNLYKRILSLGDYTARIIMDDCDCVVAPKGSELISLNQQIQNKAGKSFKGESVLDSIANACAYTCKYFVSNYSDDLSRLYEKQFWLGGR